MQSGDTTSPGGNVSAPQNQDDDRSVPQTDETRSAQPTSGEGWQYNDDDSSQDDDTYTVPGGHNGSVQWSATEFVHHDKPALWYGALMLVTVLVAGGLFLLTKDFITTAAIVLVAVAFGFVAARKPRTLEYSVDESGITISSKHYTFDLFKSFSVVEEGATASISLLPNKRFMPLISMYYPLEQEDQIVDVLGDYLPYEHRDSAVVDDIMRRLRF